MMEINASIGDRKNEMKQAGIIVCGMATIIIWKNAENVKIIRKIIEKVYITREITYSVINI